MQTNTVLYERTRIKYNIYHISLQTGHQSWYFYAFDNSSTYVPEISNV